MLFLIHGFAQRASFGIFRKPKTPEQIFPAWINNLKNGDAAVFECGIFWEMSWSIS